MLLHQVFNGILDWTRQCNWTTSRLVNVAPGQQVNSSIQHTGGNSYRLRLAVGGDQVLTDFQVPIGLSESVVYFAMEHQPADCQTYPANGAIQFDHISVEVDGQPVPRPAWRHRPLPPTRRTTRPP